MITDACSVSSGSLVDCSVPTAAQNGDSALTGSAADDSRQQSKTGKVVVSLNRIVAWCHAVAYAVYFSDLIGLTAFNIAHIIGTVEQGLCRCRASVRLSHLPAICCGCGPGSREMSIDCLQCFDAVG